MSDKKLSEIIYELERVNLNIPEIDLSSVEHKLDKMIELLENKCVIQERTESILDEIRDKIVDIENNIYNK